MSSVAPKSIFNRPPAQAAQVNKNSKPPAKLFPLARPEPKPEQLPQKSEGPHPFKLPHTDPLKPLSVKDQYNFLTTHIASLERNILDMKSSLLTYNTVLTAATLALDQKILDRIDTLTTIVQRLLSLTINSIPSSDLNDPKIQELQTLNAKLQMDNDALSTQLQHVQLLLSQSSSALPDQLNYQFPTSSPTPSPLKSESFQAPQTPQAQPASPTPHTPQTPQTFQDKVNLIDL